MSRRRLSLFGGIPARKHDSTLTACSIALSRPAEEYTTYTQVWVGKDRRAAHWWRLEVDVQPGDELAEQPIRPDILVTIEPPEFGTSDVVSRAITRCDRIEGDIFGLAKDMGYSFAYAYIEHGYRLQRRDGSGPRLSIFQVYSAKAGTRGESTSLKDYEVVGSQNCYAIEASIDVKQGNDPAEVRRATQELLRVKSELASYVDLRVVKDELR